MLDVIPKRSRAIHTIERREDRLYLYSDAYTYRLEPKSDAIVRVTVTKLKEFSQVEKLGVVKKEVYASWTYEETENTITMQLENLTVAITKETGSFTYYDASGRLLLRERSQDSKSLEEFTSYRLREGASIQKETIQTADGTKEVIKAADKEVADTLYHTRLYLDWQIGERLYGLGQQEEGLLNLRGQMVFVHQANRKIAIPLLVSSLGYGILMDTYSPMIFSDTVYGSYLYTEADYEMDFYFVYGETPNGVLRGYRTLTGKASMLPRWAFGYLQSQERYESAQELIDIVKEYRRRELGLDGIILDWCSWEDGKWGQKSLDPTRFPDPSTMVQTLHNENVHMMISIWPNMDATSEDYKAFVEEGLFLPGSNVYNALNEDGRKLYWQQVEQSLFAHGIDAWWCDSSEPYTIEWNHVERMEPAKLYEDYCREVANHIPAYQTNAFALYHAKTIYDGQRGSEKNTSQGEKRVFNLTRSAYTGHQRYGTVVWSGDTGASWQTLRKQIREGLSYSASGMPYWTADIGAFFVKPGGVWYWDGEYPLTTNDPAYRELFVRWFQWGCFLPIFRGHGTDCRRELWQFGEPGDCYYDALVKMNQLRYELFPYIYSTAGQVWREDSSFITMLAFAFPDDELAQTIEDQYMFGENLMICPVTMAMEEKESETWIYLPGGQGWYDYWTNEYHRGEQWISVSAKLDIIPIFVKEGSVVPKSPVVQSSSDCSDLILSIYAGKDATTSLYEDAGDGYSYEQGDYSIRSLHWNDETQTLTITQEHGDSESAYISRIREHHVIGKE